MRYFIRSLSKNERKDSALFITANEANAAIVQAHDLAGEAQSDTRAFGFGGEEWNEYLLLTIRADRMTIIADIYHDCIDIINLGCDGDLGCLCLQGIANEIDYHLRDLSLIRI